MIIRDAFFSQNLIDSGADVPAFNYNDSTWNNTLLSAPTDDELSAAFAVFQHNSESESDSDQSANRVNKVRKVSISPEGAVTRSHKKKEDEDEDEGPMKG